MNCSHCHEDFACGRLHAALAVAEARLERRPDVKLRAMLQRIDGRLREAGWNYPDAPGPCGLQGDAAEIQRMTDELINMLGHNGAGAKHAGA